jgi:argininosuccinate lyase
MREDTYLGMGTRLGSRPSDELAATAFSYELEATGYLWKGLGLADLAHVLTLMKSGVIARATGNALLEKLLRLHRSGERPKLDPSAGDTYNNRDVLLREVLGPDSGWIHTGRARREAATVAWQLACRERLLTLGDALISLCRQTLHVVEQHRRTVMPDFTYLVHAHPTTLAHYLLGYVYPLLRDEQRLRRSFDAFNRSPAGSGSVNGSQVPMDREYLARLLEFDGLVTHTRDAMWAPDMALEGMSALAMIMTNVDRVAEELQIWTTEEFGYLELHDSHCRTSVIMPQKKNPYGLTYLRGAARHLMGQWVGIAASNLTVSGQPDNRIFAYNDIPRALETTEGALRLLSDVLAKAVFDTARMRSAALTGFPYATDLCDHFVLRAGLDNRTAHRIVGAAIRTALDAGRSDLTLDDVLSAAKTMGVELSGFDQEALAKNKDPEQLVQTRTGIGAAADEPMQSMLDELGDRISAAERFWRRHRLLGFEDRFLNTISEETKHE